MRRRENESYFWSKERNDCRSGKKGVIAKYRKGHNKEGKV